MKVTPRLLEPLDSQILARDSCVCQSGERRDKYRDDAERADVSQQEHH